MKRKNRVTRPYLSLMTAGALIVLASCASPETESRQLPDGRPQAATDTLSSAFSQCEMETVPNEGARPAMRQTVYVPTYSYIDKDAEGWSVYLTVTLSIRNTELTHPITITSVCKYNSAGLLVEGYLEEPAVLTPLASRHFTVEEPETSDGAGSSFIVKWRSDMHVNQPVAEAVMINQEGQQNVSFITQGRVIEQEVDEPSG